MGSIDIAEFEAECLAIFDRIARTGKSYVVTRHGKPLVRIVPVESEGLSIWQDRSSYITRQGPLTEEFDLPPRSDEYAASPLNR